MVSGTKKTNPSVPPSTPLPPSAMGQTYSYNPLADYAFIPKYFGIEETKEGIEETKTTFGNPDNNLCRHMMNFFPAFSIEPAKKNTICPKKIPKNLEQLFVLSCTCLEHLQSICMTATTQIKSL